MTGGRARRWTAAAGSLAAALLAVLAACGGADDDDAASCDPVPDRLVGLAPPGTGTAAFTMLLRVNSPSDVESLSDELGDRILDRDIFVVNTEYPGSTESDWKESLDRLRDSFPCNRVMSLNGLSPRSGRAGYGLALVGEQDLDAVLLDWEPPSWKLARSGPWSANLQVNLERMETRFAALKRELERSDTRLGLVPEYLPDWDYGAIARLIGQVNWELDPAHRGYLIVQSQPNCGEPSAPGPLIGPLAAAIRGQYRPLFGFAPRSRGWVNVPGRSEAIARHLGFEVAFSSTPQRRAREAVLRVGPEQAAACSADVLARGGTAILYWAAPQDMAALFRTQAGARLRPSSSG